MEKLRQKINKCRFDNYMFGYATLYFLMVAPPRVFKIKARQLKTQGELANLPTYMIMIIELAVRFAIVLVIAASIEGLIGNTLYEINHIDMFFIAIMAIGSFHSVVFYLIFRLSVHGSHSASLTQLYRFLRNMCYASLSGLIAVIPVLIWKWDHQLPPFDDGLAIQLYSWTSIFFLFVGIVEAKIMKRMPLGTNMLSGETDINKTQKNWETADILP